MSDQPPGSGAPEEPGAEQPGWGRPPEPAGQPVSYPLQPPQGQPPYPYAQQPYQPTPQQGSRLGVSLGGFFAGVAWVIVVPGVMVTIGSTLWPDFATPGLLFTALVTFGVPLAMLVARRTRRFAAFLLIGMAVTLIVLAGVCVAFIALITSSQSG